MRRAGGVSTGGRAAVFSSSPDGDTVFGIYGFKCLKTGDDLGPVGRVRIVKGQRLGCFDPLIRNPAELLDRRVIHCQGLC